MGEYAKFRGESVKIGTCEDMYYLRHDQRHQVEAEPGNVHPVRQATEIRFRFPFPDEDYIEPGAFDPYGRGVAVHGLQPPEGVEHYSVQFRADAGYLLSLPCPESFPREANSSTLVNGLNVVRNGFSGQVKIVQQRQLPDGTLAVVCQCGGCGAKWRLSTWEEAEPLVVALRSEADREARRFAPTPEGKEGNERAARFWHQMADRVTAGYAATPALVTAD